MSKRALFFVLLLAFLWIAVEIVSYAAFFLTEKKAFSYTRTFAERSTLIHSTDSEEIEEAGDSRGHRYTIHPYLGYVKNPEVQESISRYGFNDENGLFHRRSEDKVILAIVGGSVAVQFSGNAMDFLISELKASPDFAGKEFVIQRLACGGYKQPQQLATLSYFLALGAEYDILINLDGFNDVPLAAGANGFRKVAPIYPARWYGLAIQNPDPAVKQRVGEIFYLSGKRIRLAKLFSRRPLRYSVACNLLWRILDRSKENAISRSNLELHRHETGEAGYMVRGPYHPQTEDEIYAELARIWARCSIQMDHLCRANGIEYYHFLQPNQYVPGSKIKMSDEEKEVAIEKTDVYRENVEEGYPYLFEAAEELESSRVAYRDLTMIFRDVAEPVYKDDCCHFNRLGLETLAREIAAFIVERRGAE